MHRVRDGVIDWLFFAAALLIFLARAPRLAHFLVNPDHGYQLAAGAELLRGRIPGVDVVSNFGPMIPLLAAATLRIDENLVPEVVLCAAGWALAVALVFRLTRRTFGWVAGWCAGILSLLLIARFHRWYVWLLPLGALAAIDGAAGRDRGRWLGAGLLCGLGTLFRPELGVGSLGALAIVATADALHERGRPWSAAWLPLGFGFALPVVGWALTIMAVAGSAAFADNVRDFAANLSGSVEYWSHPPPPFVWREPLAVGSAHALTLKLLLTIELAMIAVGGWFGYGEPTRALAREGRWLAAVGLVGLSFYPHTAYRADLHHLWQGIWPMLMGVPALGVLAARFRRVARARAGRTTGPALVFAGAVAASSVVAAVALAPIARLPHYDLAPLSDPPFAGIADLRRGLAAVPDHPYARLIAVVQSATRPDQPILSLESPQLLLFARRGAAGYRVRYERGIHDSEAWRDRELARLAEGPPPIVIAPAYFYDLGPSQGFRGSQPEVYAFVSSLYRSAGRWGNVLLLVRKDLVGANG